LWGGVIGEDGINGIKLGPPSAVGEAHQALQRYLLELKERGILLAVCSKNNESDAQAPFLSHPEMALKLDDFVAFFANWNDKPSNLRCMAQQLNLGIDSFVLIDDNPVERDIVRRELPEVLVPELGEDPSSYIAAISRTLCFETISISEEDRARHASYMANQQREMAMSQSVSMDGFLSSLDMRSQAGSFDDLHLARVVQLIGKTNQFNLTSRRHTESQVRALMASPAAWTRYFKLRDKYGDHGLIGVLIACERNPGVWEVDTWLMSCRVIGRSMEDYMFNDMVEALRARGAHVLKGIYLRTCKNGMVADLFDRMGFTKECIDSHSAAYLLDLSNDIKHKQLFIHSE